MTDRPILFSAPMVRALLAGRKTQTRRALKPQPVLVGGPFYRPHSKISPMEWHSVSSSGYIVNIQKLRFAPCDRLWVREAWRHEARFDDAAPRNIRSGAPIYYAADPDPRDSEPGCAGRLRASMHMPRWVSRVTLHVTDVRVQRLQDISEADAIAEGVEPEEGYWRDYLMPATQICTDPRDSYRTLWDSINGKGSWAANPWVAATSFDVERRNIDDAGVEQESRG